MASDRAGFTRYRPRTRGTLRPGLSGGTLGTSRTCRALWPGRTCGTLRSSRTGRRLRPLLIPAEARLVLRADRRGRDDARAAVARDAGIDDARRLRIGD